MTCRCEQPDPHDPRPSGDVACKNCGMLIRETPPPEERP